MVSRESDDVQLFSNTDKPYGRTYGAWTATWWQWIMPISKDRSPLLDKIGEHWNTNQPSSEVWFLIGNFARKDKTFPHRTIKIESGRSILFPVLNCMATFLEYQQLKTHDDLLRHVENDVNTVVKKELTINGKGHEAVRVPSDPRIFRVTINEDNAFEIMRSGSTDAAADGYWAFLKPVPKGNYTIRFEGSCEYGRLNAGATYELEIV